MGASAMLEFGVEVSTGELVALDRALRGLDTDAGRSALAKAHRTPVVLTPDERDAVVSALRVVLGAEPTATDASKGLARLLTKLEHEQATAVEEPPPPTRPRSSRK
ncbi:MAG TPA: hypothetical protein VD704_01940 [Gaiellaceae bacterium]|nr:hypothetical protein [Gaiellaceae bacterium]